MSGVSAPWETPPYGYPVHQPPVPPRRRVNWPARIGASLILIAVGMVLLARVWLPSTSSKPQMSGAVIEHEIRAQMERQSGETLVVGCPATVDASKGSIVDCAVGDPASGGVSSARLVRVTFDDSHGHFTWQLTDQKLGE